MDIGKMSMSLSQASLGNAVSLAVTKLQMNSMKELGAQMTEMMENMAVDPNRGTHIDVKA